MPLSRNEIFAKQTADSYSRDATLYIETLQSVFRTDSRGVLVWKSLLDESIRVVVLASLHRRILYLCSYIPTVRRPGQWRMNDTLRCKFCWSFERIDVQSTVAQCLTRIHTASRYCHKRRLLRFSPSSLIAFVAMDIFGLSPNTRQSNQLIILIPDHCLNLKRAVPMSMTTSTHMADIFFEIRIPPFCIPEIMLIDNDLQYVSRLFGMLCTDR